jgi:hypothetical protein
MQTVDSGIVASVLAVSMHARVALGASSDMPHTVHWVDPPHTRGTFDLLVSFSATLLLCVWTALHLNIPRQGESVIGKYTRKLGWTLIALFAPELVVFAAWRQWVSAKALCEKVNKLRSDEVTKDVSDHHAAPLRGLTVSRPESLRQVMTVLNI